jgi:hypothetical protein
VLLEGPRALEQHGARAVAGRECEALGAPALGEPSERIARSQRGQLGSDAFRAAMLASQLGYWLAEHTLSPRFYLGFDWSSGGDDGVFDQLAADARQTRYGAGADRHRVGAERDLVGKWQIDPHTALFAGYGHFFPGPFIAETGQDAATDFVYLTLQYTF